MDTSKRFKLNKADLKKIGKGAIVAMLGAGLIYFADIVKDIDFGQYGPVVAAIAAILINTARKFLGNGN
mgnify:CR=1 FL=1